MLVVNIAHPIILAVGTTLLFFAGKNGHIALWFIQLELISILAIYFLFVEVAASNIVPFAIIILFTVLASEGAVGLGLIINRSRGMANELQKVKF